MTEAEAGRRGAWGVVLALATVAAVFWVGYSQVRPTNFGGADEWLLIELASRGVVDFPYANRPLVLLWTAVAAHAWPDDLRAFWLFNGLYLVGAGWLTGLLTRRLFPDVPALALLAGVFAAVWAPLDGLRLSGVLSCGYAGFTLCTMAALTLFLESWHRRRLDLLLVAAALGFVAARGVESVIPVLLVAPALLWKVPPSERPRAFKWMGIWWAVVALELVLAVWPMLSGAPSYQGGALGLDAAPHRVAGRLLQLLGMQAAPLVSTAVGELASSLVALAAVAFALPALVLLGRRAGPVTHGADRRAAVHALVLGLLLAGAAHGGLALSRTISTPARTQILSGPGFALALAAAVVLVGSWLPGRASRLGIVMLGTWVVAVGTGRTVAQQGEWDAFRSVFAPQHRTLTDLVEAAPGLAPGTLVVVVGGEEVWPLGFTFRHAVSHLYPDQAVGLVPGGADMLYPWTVAPEGFVVTPWPTIRDPWGVEPSFHPWSSLVVVRVSDGGALEIVEEWPTGELPPLPEGARYAPRDRIDRDGPRPSSRGILRVDGV